MKKIMLAVCALCLLCAVAVPSSAQAAANPSDRLLAAIFQTPQTPIQASRCIVCITNVVYSTTTISGSGGNCTNAQSSLSSQLRSIADSDCLSWTGMLACNFQVVTTSSCTQVSPGVWQVQGYSQYSCREDYC